MRIFKQIEIFLCLCGVLFGSFCAPAAADAAVGEVTMSVEAFSIGCGYLVEPTRLSFYAGETDADLLLRGDRPDKFVAHRQRPGLGSDRLYRYRLLPGLLFRLVLLLSAAAANDQ